MSYLTQSPRWSMNLLMKYLSEIVSKSTQFSMVRVLIDDPVQHATDYT